MYFYDVLGRASTPVLFKIFISSSTTITSVCFRCISNIGNCVIYPTIWKLYTVTQVVSSCPRGVSSSWSPHDFKTRLITVVASLFPRGSERLESGLDSLLDTLNYTDDCFLRCLDPCKC